jgi:beta-glucanase (GH16 family)
MGTTRRRRRLFGLLVTVVLAGVLVAVLFALSSGSSQSPVSSAAHGRQGASAYPTGRRGVTRETPPPTTAPVGTNGASSDPTAGLSLAFNQRFAGTSLSTSTWSTCYPGQLCTNYGNSSEEEWYRRSADVVSGGALHLVATQTPTAGTNASGAPESFPYKSGMITTHRSFQFTYGYVQVVAQIPGGTGTWPALWLLPQTTEWPPEIDIMENFGAANSIRTTYIWGTADAPEQASQNIVTSSNLTNGYHTYGLLWKPGSLTWYLDGKVIDTFNSDTVSSKPMYFLANLAIDGPANSKSSFNIQSVKIYT